MQAGSQELWHAVVAQRARALRVARARCQDPQDAEDCVQEGMARVASMSDVDPARIGSLLTTVVANLAVDVHRAGARASRLRVRLSAQADLHERPEESICDAEEARWLWASRSVLAEQDRAVFERRAAGQSVRETAHALGITYKAAESAYTRARRTMRAVWRSTAAALGLLWRPHREPAGTPVPVMVAATAAIVIAVLLLMPWAALAPEGDKGASPVLAAPSRPLLDRAVPASATAAPPAVQQVTTTRARPAPPPSRVLISTPAVGVAGLRTRGGVQLERRDPDESMIDTVERCVRAGVTISLNRVACNDEPG